MILNLTDAIRPDSDVLVAISGIVSPECQAEIASSTNGKIYSDNFAEYFDNIDCLRGASTSFEDFEGTLDEQFCNAFTAVKGYHATRIVDEQGFRENGIVKLDDALLAQISAAFFGDRISAGDISASLEQIEIPEYDQGVFLFWHKESATTRGYDHYLKAGPEVFGNHNFETASTKSTGRPCIIHCDVPIEIITPSMRKCIWYYLIVSSIEFSIETFSLHTNLGMTFSTSENVPSGAIKQFEYVNLD